MSLRNLTNARGWLVIVLLAVWTLSTGPVAWAQTALKPGALSAAQTRSGATELSSLPLPAQAAISAALGRDQPSYHAVTSGSGFQAKNPKHGLAADFAREGIEVRTGGVRWGLRFSGFGYGEALGGGAAVAPQATANRVEYRRGALTEWYVNGPLGLEQGFTLESVRRGRKGADP